jgi:ketosteroid isomerase-like protein
LDRRELREWIAAYERAWRAGGTAALSELFSGDATYRTAPYERAYRGLEAIAELWEREREGPGEVFTIDSEIIAVEGDTGVARVEVRYGDPARREYRDLWIVRFDASGRCAEFEEWPFWPSGSSGSFARGPEGETLKS